MAELEQRLKGLVPLRLRQAVAALRGRLPSLGVAPERSARRFDYDRRLLPNAYLAELDAGARSIDEAAVSTGLSLGYPAWNLLYYALLTSLDHPEPIVVETGTNLGFSSIVMAEALREAGVAGVVRTVDIRPEVVEKAREHVARAGVADRVAFHVGDSVAFLRGLAAEVSRLDFVFLDGSHERDVVLAELEAVRPLVAACRGKVYLDNTIGGGVGEALAEFKRRHGGNLVEFRKCSWSPPGNAIWMA